MNNGDLIGLATLPFALVLLYDTFQKESVVPKELSIPLNVGLILINVFFIFIYARGVKNK